MTCIHALETWRSKRRPSSTFVALRAMHDSRRSLRRWLECQRKQLAWGFVKDFMVAAATEPSDLAALRMLSGEVFKATEPYGPGCIFLTGYYEARDIGASIDSWSKYLGIFDDAYADDDAFLPVFAVLTATHELTKNHETDKERKAKMKRLHAVALSSSELAALPRGIYNELREYVSSMPELKSDARASAALPLAAPAESAVGCEMDNL